MPRALITGAGGFVGGYLARHLQTLGYEVWGASMVPCQSESYRNVLFDVRDAEQVRAVTTEVRPNEIYHLAGISRPALDTLRDYYDVNLYGTLNVLQVAQEVSASVLVVSTAYVYGRQAGPIIETCPLEPLDHYGASKAAAELAAASYSTSGQRVVRVRPFNHSGPGQSPDFILPSLISQIARIEAGLLEPVIKIGNLTSVRDFSDVRDIVAAYPRLLRDGESGGVYNLASGIGVSVEELIREVVQLSGRIVRIDQQPARFRASDIPCLVGNASKARECIGWHPVLSLQRTLRDMFKHELSKIQ